MIHNLEYTPSVYFNFDDTANVISDLFRKLSSAMMDCFNYLVRTRRITSRIT